MGGWVDLMDVEHGTVEVVPSVFVHDYLEWVGGWVGGGEETGERGGWNEVMDVMGRWVGGWVGLTLSIFVRTV